MQSTKEYFKFCNIACGSAFETRYLAELAFRLGFLSKVTFNNLKPSLDTLCASLVKLVAALALEAAAEKKRRRSRADRAVSLQPESPKPPKPEA